MGILHTVWLPIMEYQTGQNGINIHSHFVVLTVTYSRSIDVIFIVYISFSLLIGGKTL